MSEELEEAARAEERLVLACQAGDARAMQQLLTANLGLDVAMTTEGGVTLLMHTIIGAG